MTTKPLMTKPNYYNNQTSTPHGSKQKKNGKSDKDNVHWNI